MVPLAEGKSRVKLTLDILVYRAFVILCRRRKYGQPSHIVESFMRACLKNPTLIALVLKIAYGQSPIEVSKQVDA
ncbi:MAG: hypothetical protein QXK89_09840 [Candidatus Bathyarchaeia archaeon]